MLFVLENLAVIEQLNNMHKKYGIFNPVRSLLSNDNVIIIYNL